MITTNFLETDYICIRKFPLVRPKHKSSFRFNEFESIFAIVFFIIGHVVFSLLTSNGGGNLSTDFIFHLSFSAYFLFIFLFIFAFFKLSFKFAELARTFFTNHKKLTNSFQCFSLPLSSALPEDPEFTDVIENITVPAGRNIKLACSVKNLGSYKVCHDGKKSHEF